MKSVVVIGNFDGVHRGHQSVIQSAKEIAIRLGVEAAVLTFDPHPSRILGRPEPTALTLAPRKRELLLRAGADRVFTENFDETFASLSPQGFVDYLVATFQPVAVCVGHNFRFGKARAGDLPLLESLGKSFGFSVHQEPVLSDSGAPVSSSRIRALIANANLNDAADLLGRPHMLSGVVSEGDKRGRELGYPTANLDTPLELLPPNGVYAVLVDQGLDKRALGKGVMNLGVRPTVKNAQTSPTAEIHVLDFSGDLYGQPLSVHLIERLRDEQKFPNVETLRAQITRDADQARSALAMRKSYEGSYDRVSLKAR